MFRRLPLAFLFLSSGLVAGAQTLVTTWASPDGPPAPRATAPVAAEGAFAASGSQAIDDGNRVIIYDLPGGQQRHVVPSIADEPAGLGTYLDSIALDVDAGRVAVGSPADAGAGTDAGRVLVYDAVSGAELGDFTAPDAQPFDEFGTSIALDGNRLLVGAPNTDDLGADAGSAYVLDATTGALLFELYSETPQASAHFGAAVALENGYAVVGEPDFGTGNRGTAYVFDVATGAQVAKLVPSDAVAGMHFGTSLAIHGNRLVVGAPGTGNLGSVPVGAYVYDLTTGNELFDLVPSGALPKQFGQAVAIDAERVLVGAPGEYEGSWDAGATYVFDVADGTETARLTIGCEFGESVALASGLGLSTTCVANLSGSVHTIDADSGALVGALEAINGPYFDLFGHRVAIDGDHALVVSDRDDGEGLDYGRVYLYEVSTGTQLTTLANPLPGPLGNSFGDSVALEGNRAVVGIPDADVPTTSMGAVAVYDVPTGALVDLWTMPLPVGTGAQFGWGVDIHDGRALVGARYAANAGAGAGAAFVYDLASGDLLHSFFPPVGEGAYSFGESVALGGPWAIVGGTTANVDGGDYWPVHVYDVGTGALVSTLLPAEVDGSPWDYGTVATDGTRVLVGSGYLPGAVWLFDAATGAELWKATPSDPGVAAFGETLAIAGSLAVVGAPTFASNPGAGTSGVFGFDLATGQQRFQLMQSDPYDHDRASIALDGATLLVGLPHTDDPVTNAGAVEVFDVPEVPAALPYCGPKTSDAGCQSLIAYSGPSAVPTSGQGDWAVVASGVQGKRSGLLIGGLSGPAAIPFSGGTLCVAPPHKRGSILSSGGMPGACDGSYQTTVNDTGFPQGFDAGPGQTAWYQWWYRDPPNPTGPVALSNALEVPFL